MIADRLKLKRQANRLSLQDFADLLSQYDTTITRAALSNYENGRAVPGEELLAAMRQALGISQGFLERETFPVKIVYFWQHDLIPRRQLELDSYVTVSLERRIEIDRIVNCKSDWQPPERLKIAAESDFAKIPPFVQHVRESWGLSKYPISSVTNLLETWGWDIYELPASFGVPGVVGYDQESAIPFLYFPVRAGIVNVRMQLLVLVSAAYLDVKNEALRSEAARRFATNLLFSDEQARREFGSRRSAIGAEELSLAKNRYGLPKYEIMGRLMELGIIDRRLYQNYMGKIRQQGYPSSRDTMAEPLFFYENSAMYKMKLQYALAENLLEGENSGSDLIMPNLHKGQ